MAKVGEKTCEICGGTLPAEAPLGLCPSCLMRAGAKLVERELAGTDDEATESAEAEPVPGRLGDYELLEEIGRGGMGVVFKARQPGLNRVVAIKTILAGEFADATALIRFRMEAEAAALLRHPNIVAVYETGMSGRRPWFSMEYVAGRNLEEIGKAGPLDPARAARYVRKVALAVHAAHERGILHRDLKPSNVLVGEDDEPRVTDFGLAKRLETGATVTLPGQLLGSPNFMPPEQAATEGGETSVRGDVYGLGAILYFLLTGGPPFRARTIPETLRQVAEREPASPRTANPRTPADLATICLKCMEKAPEARYASALEVAEELGRFLEGRPVRAHPAGPLARLAKWCRRKPVLASLTAGLALLLGVVLVGSPAALVSIRTQRNHAQALLYDADMSLAFAALRDHRLDRVRELLERHRPARGETDLRGWEWGYLWEQSQPDAVAMLRGLTSEPISLAFSHDGRWLVAGRYDSNIVVWETATRRMVTNLACPGWPAELAFNEGNTRLLAVIHPGAGEKSGFATWSTADWRLIAGSTMSNSPRLAAISPNGRYLVRLGPDGTLSVRELATDRLLLELPPLEGAGSVLRRPVFAARAPVVAATGSAGITVWDFERRRKLRSISFKQGMHAFAPAPLALSPDGHKLAVGGPPAQVFDVTRDTKAVVLSRSPAGALSLAFSPDGRRLALADSDLSITLWDTETWEPWPSLRGLRRAPYALAFSPDGRTLASTGRERGIPLWDASGPPPRGRTFPMPTRFTGIDFSGGPSLLYRYAPNRFLVFHGAPNAWTNTVQLPCAPAGMPAVSWDGNLLGFAKAPGKCVIWNVEANREQAVLAGENPHFFPHREFSPDGSKFLGADGTNHVRVVWDTQSGRQIARLPFGRSRRGAWGPDSVTVLLFDGPRIGVWDLEKNAIRHVLLLDAECWTAALSPDQRFIASLDGRGEVRLWDVGGGRPLARLGNRGSARISLYALAFSPDSRRLCVAGGLNGPRIYDLLTFQELGSPPFDFLAKGCRFHDPEWLIVGGSSAFHSFHIAPFDKREP